MTHKNNIAKIKTCIILHNIRSAYNVGSILRTADAAGVSKVYMTGFTPTPVDRFGRKRKDVAKVALGAEDTVPWGIFARISPLLDKLKKEGFDIIAIEQSPRSVDFRKIKTGPNPTVLVFGNEVQGLSSTILKKCDVIAEIPMRGKKESLNVSVAVGIVLFGALKK